MSLIPLAFAVLATGLCWMGQGMPLHPYWGAALLPLLVWGLAVGKKRREWLGLGFTGLVALAGVCAASGATASGLGGMALALMAWDSTDLLHWRGERRELQRVMARGFLRSGLVASTGWALGFGASRLRLTFPFWGLVGLAALAWLALWAWTHSVQRRGGEAKGNLSESGPIK